MTLKYKKSKKKKNFTTSDYNNFINDILDAKIKQKGLADKSDIFALIKNSYLNTKLITLATKSQLKAGQDKMVKFQVFNSSYFYWKAFLDMMAFKIFLFIKQHLTR